MKSFPPTTESKKERALRQPTKLLLTRYEAVRERGFYGSPNELKRNEPPADSLTDRTHTSPVIVYGSHRVSASSGSPGTTPRWNLHLGRKLKCVGTMDREECPAK